MSNDFQSIVRFSGLFSGRLDAYFNGKVAVWRRPTLNIIRDHLSGKIEGIGTYPVTDAALCKWGCIDLDGDQYTFVSATDVVSVWNYYGIEAWIERSRSKGWHIWTFSNGWCPAYVMRYAGLQVAKICELPTNTEVNPKNIAPWKTSNGLVNTVRLPYAGRAAPGRQVVLDPRSAMPLSWQDFTAAATASLAGRSELQAIASQWQLAAQQEALERRFSALAFSQPSGDWHSQTNQEAMQILKGERNVAKGERDNQFYSLARLMKGINIPYKEALDKMTKIWYDQTPDKDKYDLETAIKKVDRVYGGLR